MGIAMAALAAFAIIAERARPAARPAPSVHRHREPARAVAAPAPPAVAAPSASADEVRGAPTREAMKWDAFFRSQVKHGGGR